MGDVQDQFFSETFLANSKAEVLPPTIVIIESRALIRDCLAMCLREKLGLPVLTFSSVSNWRQSRHAIPAGVILLGGVEESDVEQAPLVSELSSWGQDVPVIVISEKVSSDRVASSLLGGAKGYIPSDTPLEIVARAIKLVLVGGVFVPADAAIEMWQGAAPNTAQSEKAPGFTARELEVAKALLKGMSNKVIAHELGVSESSVKLHIRNVMRKLQVRNRTEAAIKLGDILSP